MTRTKMEERLQKLRALSHSWNTCLYGCDNNARIIMFALAAICDEQANQLQDWLDQYEFD